MSSKSAGEAGGTVGAAGAAEGEIEVGAAVAARGAREAAYLLERAWVDGEVRDDVLVTIADGVFTSVTPGARNLRFAHEASWANRRIHRLGGESTTPTHLPGLTLPGLANCHSHAFHRALRGRTQRGGGTFWTWREQMYELAGRLDPDSLFALARAVYREMVAGGVTAVGEFHYLHHGPQGRPYADPHAMSVALAAAAAEAGLRLCLLDACYLSSGFGAPPEGVQRRFADADVDAWAGRADALRSMLAREHPAVVAGAAIHSVRAVPRPAMAQVARWAERYSAPLHAHVSEQLAENEACRAAYNGTPTEVLDDSGALGAHATAVHATHLTGADIGLLGASRTHACFCPTTERDLGDGIGPSRALHAAGSPLTLGSDSHAVVDLFEEMRAVEAHERLASQRRGHWPAGELLDAATGTGHASLGFPDAGRLAPGSRADLVVVSLESPGTAGTGGDEHTAVYAATAADVVSVMVDGRWVVGPGDRAEVGRELQTAVAAAWGE